MQNYSIKENPTLTDLPLIWDEENSAWKRTPFSAIFALYNESFTNVVLEPDTQYSVPLTGENVIVNVDSTDVHLTVVPAGTIAALTITLPDPTQLRDKQTLLVTSTQIITALTVSGSGAVIHGSPTAMTAGGYFKLKYDLALNVWNRVG